ncbi:MAG TPA: ABC transporter ATP-binding protein [Acidobacteriota bacterium]|jgi:putative ABC transport system ATP-binding protein
MSNVTPHLLRQVRSMKSILEVRELRMTFRAAKIEVHALNGVNLVVKAGEFVAIMGPSGCGKSTLLHILGGLLQPTAGEVYIDGTEIGAVNDAQRTEIRRKKIGFVFQRFNLLSTLTAVDNIRVAKEIRRDTNAHFQVDEVLGMVGLGNKLHHKPFEMSGGEQQRVAVARAIVNRPAILLADEPTGNLDSSNSERVLALLKSLNEQYQQTVIMITHDPDAASYASRIVEMKDGRILNRVQHVVYAVENGGLF